MDILEKLLGHENCKIKFSTAEGDYIGTLKRIAPEIQLIVFAHLIWLEKNVRFGTLTFRAKEIEAFTILQGPLETPKLDVASNLANLYGRDFQGPAIFDVEYDMNSCYETELISVLESDYKEYTFKMPPSLSDYLPSDNIIIDTIGMDFSDAVRHFRKQNVIGINLEGPKIGRYEDIHWLCISTAYCTFLFDIKTLGVSAFDRGLREILESSTIEKVIHDCRDISDCLFHRYDTRLSHVFDTQVAEFIINHQEKNDSKITEDMHSLNFCLAYYLNVPEDFLLCRKKRSYRKDLIIYDLRPLGDPLRHLFTKNVIYLRLLKTELDILLLKPLHDFIDNCMDCVRSLTDRELELASLHPWVASEQMLLEEILIFRFKKHINMPPVVLSGPPFREVEDSYMGFAKYCQLHKMEYSAYKSGKNRNSCKDNLWRE